MTEQERLAEIERLYHEAFRSYGTVALWSYRERNQPTPEDALVLTRALRTRGGMEGRRLAERVEQIATNDVAALSQAGLVVEWLGSQGPGVRRATVRDDFDSTLNEWVADADFRFFPTTEGELFGYVLHPVDLATNKVAAAAGRREPRDIVDLLTIHEQILPLGAAIAAAVGRFPGPSPEELLSEIGRRSWLTPPELAALSMETPIDPADLHRRVRAMLDDADSFLKRIPSDAVGFVFLENGKPVQPDPTRLADYVRHARSRRGSWPSSKEIDSAMLKSLTKNDD